MINEQLVNDSLTRGFEFVTRGFELVIRNL